MEEWLRPGVEVVLADGKRGRLCSPRGCFCGPKGEPCWDIAYLDEIGGVQAHGGTFKPKLTGGISDGQEGS